jgi:hypothetical protein
MLNVKFIHPNGWFMVARMRHAIMRIEPEILRFDEGENHNMRFRFGNSKTDKYYTFGEYKLTGEGQKFWEISKLEFIDFDDCNFTQLENVFDWFNSNTPDIIEKAIDTPTNTSTETDTVTDTATNATATDTMATDTMATDTTATDTNAMATDTTATDTATNATATDTTADTATNAMATDTKATDTTATDTKATDTTATDTATDTTTETDEPLFIKDEYRIEPFNGTIKYEYKII